LSNNVLTQRILREILFSSMQRLRHLDLRNNRIEEDASLLWIPRELFNRGTFLELHGNELGAGSFPPVLVLNQEPDSSREPASPGKWPSRISNSLGMELALIPAGTFLMGSPDAEFAEERTAN